MKSLEHKIPPPIVGLLIAAAMWGIAKSTAATLAVPDPVFAAAVVALVGLAFDLAGILSFLRAKTTVNPLKPEKATALVTSGVYRLTRNPMYVGMLFLLIAWAIYLDSPWALLGPLAFVLYMNWFQIGPEEKALEELFGDKFSDYKRRVRRWL
jgi:protein-S-isoprenylcysteine O-methyltransferase Ste14